MGKNKAKRKSKKSSNSASVDKIEIKEVKEPSINVEEEEESETDMAPKLTLEALDAISDEEEDGPEDEDAAEWNAEAKALRQAIAEGAFDKLLSKGGKERTDGKIATKKEMEQETKNDSDSEMHEVALEDDSSSDEEEGNKSAPSKGIQKAVISNPKALKAVTEEQEAKKYGMAWAETFDVIPESSLPFGANGSDGNPLDVHDDLKREVAFYNLALEAVHIAREKCQEANIPFTRPVDYFAEMVKTDGTFEIVENNNHISHGKKRFISQMLETILIIIILFFFGFFICVDHMAKVKDRLIFETKKMEAFEQRKSNREQKLRAKEKHAHRLAEKAKVKKNHMKAVEDWAKDAQSNRLSGGRVHDNDDDYLSRINGGPGKKRIAADKKFGYGGKRGRFKQNDAKSMNDMSGFNPRGNFDGGRKSSAASGGKKRHGKRARDAAKSRR